MTRIDLITGFLGSGKTTFLKKYVKYLISKGERICILENDYGAINVDMMLLQEFNNICDMEMVAGGCDFDCHKRRFKTKLIAMGMKGYDRVIIEPSGIFDTDEFFDTLYEEPLDSWYEIGSVISILDPAVKNNISAESEYVLINQISSSGKIIISKTDEYNDNEIDDTINYLDYLMTKYNMHLDKNIILRKHYDDYTEEDYETIKRASYRSEAHEKMNIMEVNKYSSIYFMNTGFKLDELKAKANILFNDQSFGNIMRIKGFLKDNDKWLEFNMTKEVLNVNELSNGQDVVIIIGEGISEAKIKEFLGRDE
ncbi:MAG: hypothetical protein K6A63_08330 [Acholeplasmatales bacterium]|nr:hypothetical protein [Acholeplasmatales bacterium]